MPDVSAYHEAGHAFMAIYVGARVRSITIEPNHDDGPQRFGEAQIEWFHRDFTPRELCEKSILVALAGPVAEMLYTGEPYHPGLVPQWQADWVEAWQTAANLHRDERRRLAYLERVTSQLYKTLNHDQNWAALAAIADNLLAYDTLEGEEVAQIVSAWLG